MMQEAPGGFCFVCLKRYTVLGSEHAKNHTLEEQIAFVGSSTLEPEADTFEQMEWIAEESRRRTLAEQRSST